LFCLASDAKKPLCRPRNNSQGETNVKFTPGSTTQNGATTEADSRILSRSRNIRAKLHRLSNRRIKRGILNLRLDLKEYEEKYQLSTKDFYQQFTQGTVGDREDYIIWAGLYEMLRTNEQRSQELE
jgi:hypothetical protein